MQQYLPFTVLKLSKSKGYKSNDIFSCNSTYRLRYWNFIIYILRDPFHSIATVLTVYGIETNLEHPAKVSLSFVLQQYLPFTVLKLSLLIQITFIRIYKLQQYLPFTVLKRLTESWTSRSWESCNSTYRLRYWNLL